MGIKSSILNANVISYLKERSAAKKSASQLDLMKGKLKQKLYSILPAVLLSNINRDKDVQNQISNFVDQGKYGEAREAAQSYAAMFLARAKNKSKTKLV